MRHASLTLVLALAAGLLLIGIRRDFELKHEDNNALYATFARAHLRVGPLATRFQDTFVDRVSGARSTYGHHPPGVALALAAWMSLWSGDSPAVVRGLAITHQLLALLLFWRLFLDRLDGSSRLVGGLLFAVLPMGAFFGRMVNHEPLALPAMILMVDRYLAWRRGARLAALSFALAAVWGTMLAWASFFTLAACAFHAARDAWRGDRQAARCALGLALAAGLLAVALLGLLAWGKGGSGAELWRTLASRAGGGAQVSPLGWASHELDIGRRYFSAVGVLAAIWALVAWLRRPEAPWVDDPSARALEASAIFLMSGLSYALLFNMSAWAHHYWLYPMLPGVVLALVLASQRLRARLARARASRRAAWMALALLAAAEIVFTSATTSYQRHTRQESYCIRTVADLRQKFL